MSNLYNEICKIENLLSAWMYIKGKGSTGGIDGVSIEMFEKDSENNLNLLSQELIAKRYIPLPYKEIKIPKDDNEFRSLSLPSIKDKIVQQAIREIIEPVLEREFLNVSYGYRKNKGPGKAILRVTHLINNEKRQWLTNCDIDKYFDTIHHNTLFNMLSEKLKDNEIVTLIRCFIKMGKVDTCMKWVDSAKGIPQGNILSPLLSNLYLHPLDKMMAERNYGYIRYADDFIVLSKTEREAYSALSNIRWFLKNKIHQQLNPNALVKHIESGFEFLGITFKENEKIISEKKLTEIKDKIKHAIETDTMESVEKTSETINGVANYYGQILGQQYLEDFDEWIVQCFKIEARKAYQSGKFSTKSEIEKLLKGVDFISEKFRIKKSKAIKSILAYCVRRRKELTSGNTVHPKTTRDPVKKRKREYQRLEAEGFSLVISTPGVFIGKTKKGIIIKNRGTKLHESAIRNLKHIFILSQGILLSSNVIAYCTEKKIPIDFIAYDGKPYARIYPFADASAEIGIEQLKAVADSRGHHLAKCFVGGKIRNQINLAKYYNKYRKNINKEFSALVDEKTNNMEKLLEELKKLHIHDTEILRGQLFSIEGRAAQSYWDIVQILLDDVLSFEGRERKGATDIVNSLLNYGYGILYSQIWQAVSRARLSPFISYLHKPQTGKPTLIFDLIEEFRPQAVDRAIFSMINKGVELKMDGKYLSLDTKKKVVTEVIDRINTVEQFRGKEMRLSDIIIVQSKAVASFIIGESKRYLPYIGKW